MLTTLLLCGIASASTGTRTGKAKKAGETWAAAKQSQSAVTAHRLGLMAQLNAMQDRLETLSTRLEFWEQWAVRDYTCPAGSWKRLQHPALDECLKDITRGSNVNMLYGSTAYLQAEQACATLHAPFNVTAPCCDPSRNPTGCAYDGMMQKKCWDSSADESAGCTNSERPNMCEYVWDSRNARFTNWACALDNNHTSNFARRARSLDNFVKYESQDGACINGISAGAPAGYSVRGDGKCNPSPANLGELTTVAGGSLQDCANSCDSDGNCLHFVYSPDANPRCRLKSSSWPTDQSSCVGSNPPGTWDQDSQWTRFRKHGGNILGYVTYEPTATANNQNGGPSPAFIAACQSQCSDMQHLTTANGGQYDGTPCIFATICSAGHQHSCVLHKPNSLGFNNAQAASLQLTELETRLSPLRATSGGSAVNYCGARGLWTQQSEVSRMPGRSATYWTSRTTACGGQDCKGTPGNDAFGNSNACFSSDPVLGEYCGGCRFGTQTNECNTMADCEQFCSRDTDCAGFIINTGTANDWYCWKMRGTVSALTALTVENTWTFYPKNENDLCSVSSCKCYSPFSQLSLDTLTSGSR